ncbi:MAG: betI [Solirubrobacterales bacterium]|nr:betI [Solirubrobacterales bacterium]
MPRTIRDPTVPERLSGAAARAIAAHGVRGATVRVIAAEAGVSTGSITHYFADKNEIVEAALAFTNRAAAGRVRGAVSGDEAALDRLRTVVEVMLPITPARRREWQVWVAVWSEASGGGPLSISYKAAWNGLCDIVVELLDDARRHGELPAGTDTGRRADRLVTLLAGIGLLAGVEKPARVRELAEQLLAEELA